jgi:hypothetical protein
MSIFRSEMSGHLAMMLCLTVVTSIAQFYLAQNSDYSNLVNPANSSIVMLRAIKPSLPLISCAVSLLMGLAVLTAITIFSWAKRPNLALLSGEIIFVLAWNVAFGAAFFWLVVLALGELGISQITSSSFIRLFASSLCEITIACAVFAGVIGTGIVKIVDLFEHKFRTKH